MKTSSYKTVKAFLDAVGRDRFERELGHSKQVVSRAVVANIMPAHWFFECRDWCAEIGVSVPENLFRQSRNRSLPLGKHSANQLRNGQLSERYSPEGVVQ